MILTLALAGTCVFPGWSIRIMTVDMNWQLNWGGRRVSRGTEGDAEVCISSDWSFWLKKRHHKHTPYASNTFFKEDVSWNCIGSCPVVSLARSVDVLWVQPSRDLKTHRCGTSLKSNYAHLVSMFYSSSGRQPFLDWDSVVGLRLMNNGCVVRDFMNWNSRVDGRAIDR